VVTTLLVVFFCRPGAAAADVVRILDSNWEAAQARIDLIEQARTEIVLSYYSIANDKLAGMYLSLLRDAAQRGVAVRLVIDAMHNHIPSQVQEELLRVGVRIKEYHTLECKRPGWINRRLHDKLLLIDRAEMIIGSRNLDERHFGLAKVKRHLGIPTRTRYIDRDVYVKGRSAEQAGNYFDCLWSSPEVRDTRLKDPLLQSLIQDDKLEFDRLGNCARAPDGQCRCCQGAAWLAAATPIAVDCQPLLRDTWIDWSAGEVDVGCVDFLFDPMGRKHHPEGISPRIHELIERAQHSVFLESPYFTLSTTLKQVIRDARARGVAIRIMTNSLASTDQILVYAGYSNQKRFLLNEGVELWEYTGPARFHAKSALIDGSVAMVGSYNFDPRSEHLNTELAVVVYDPEFVGLLTASIAENMGHAHYIRPDGRAGPERIHHPGATRAKILALQPMRIFAPIIRRSL
jgi:phosphatidylserine/phosphatidylglycerophosphate/cardiolipin synthase-like enzyme